MASNYPTSIDSFTDPLTNSPLNNPSHAGQHQDLNDAVEKLETKLGIGSSPASAASNKAVLVANGSGSTSWSTDLETRVAALEAYGFTWTSYTPTISGGTSAVGNGTLDFIYTTVNDIVNLYGKFTLGSTSVVGTTLSFSLPIIADSKMVSMIVGNAHLNDATGADYVSLAIIETTSAVRVRSTKTGASSNEIDTGLSPFTWAVNDFIALNFQYKAA